MYIGEKKIKEYTEEEGRVKVEFEDGSFFAFTRKMFDASLTTDPINATQLQERQVLAVQTDLMALLLIWDIKMADIPALLQWSANYIDQKHDLATDKLWGNKYKERTFGDLNKVLTTDVRGDDNPTSS